MHDLICSQSIFYSMALWYTLANICLNHEISNNTADSTLSIHL